MTKRIITLLIAALFAFDGMAQKVDVGRFEAEIGLGLADGLKSLNLDNCTPGPKIYGELRYNIKALPIDLGIQASDSYFRRSDDQVKNVNGVKCNAINVMAVADYNLRRGKNLSIFAGVGLGLGILDVTAPISFDDTQLNWNGYKTGDGTSKFAFMPRVGVELWNHLRLTVAFTTLEKANNQYSINIGVVFGGGRR